ALGWRWRPRISATTAPDRPKPTGVTPSTSTPAMVSRAAMSFQPMPSGRATSSRNQLSDTFISSPAELLGQPGVPGEEQTQIVDAVAQHGHAVDAEAEGESRVALAVVADVAEDLGIDHAAAPDLQEAGALAGTAAAASAEAALQVHLGA